MSCLIGSHVDIYNPDGTLTPHPDCRCIWCLGAWEKCKKCGKEYLWPKEQCGCKSDE